MALQNDLGGDEKPVAILEFLLSGFQNNCYYQVDSEICERRSLFPLFLNSKNYANHEICITMKLVHRLRNELGAWEYGIPGPLLPSSKSTSGKQK